MEPREETDRLVEIDLRRIVAVDTEAAVVRSAGVARPRHPAAVEGLPGNGVEEREPNADKEVRTGRADPADEVGEEPRPAVEIPPIPPLAAPRGEKLVNEVAMAGLEVDHVEAGGGGEPGGRDVGLDERLDLGVGENAARIGRRAVAGVEEWMVKRDPWLPRPGGGLAEPAGVGELEGDDEIVIATVGLAVGGSNGVEEQAEAVAPQGGGDELARVGPPGGDDRHRLPSPHELCPADPEVAPPSQERFGGKPVRGGVPALHRVDRPAVADHPAADRHRPRQRRALGGREDRLVDRQWSVERRPMGLERGDGSEAGGAREHGNGNLPRAERESMGTDPRYAPGTGTPSPATSSAAGAGGRLPPACSEWRGVVVSVLLSSALATPSSLGISR